MRLASRRTGALGSRQRCLRWKDRGTILIGADRAGPLCCVLSTSSDHQDPTLRWAQANPHVAQLCLVPPRTADLNGVDPAFASERAKSVEGYLKWRRWSMPRGVSDFDEGAATALASHVLSVPLTLGSNVEGLFNRRADRPVNRWCCIGARAEASLPSVYWREFLLLGSALMVGNDDVEARGVDEETRIQVSLDFVGPDIPPTTVKQTVSLSCGDADSDANSNSNASCAIFLSAQHRGLFHENSDAASVSWDAYVFFNPGFGHPNLKEGWDETMRKILDHDVPSSRVMLLTAHSEKDAARDAGVLKNHYGLSNVEYAPNPFASRITYKDPFESDHHLVQPNQFVSVIRI